MKIIHYYRVTDAPHSLLPSIREQLSQQLPSSDDDGGGGGEEVPAAEIASIETESCFNVQVDAEDGYLDGVSTERLEWLLRETFDRDGLRLERSAFAADASGPGCLAASVVVFEFGPRMTFTSAFSSNATSICAACGLTSISRLERSRRYRVSFANGTAPSDAVVSRIRGMLHDRMTEEEYAEPITTFESGATVKPVVRVPIMTEGREALVRINNERGLGFDDFDLDFYTDMFKVRGVCVEVRGGERERERERENKKIDRSRFGYIFGSRPFNFDRSLGISRLTSDYRILRPRQTFFIYILFPRNVMNARARHPLAGEARA